MEEKKSPSLLGTIIKLPFKILFSRFTWALVSLLIQAGVIYFATVFFNKYLLWLIGGVTVLGLLITLYIINRPGNPSFKISWIILILVFPALGVFVYLFVKLQVGVQQLSKKYQNLRNETSLYLKQDQTVLKKIMNKDMQVGNYVTYMNRMAGYPMYQNSKTTYYPLGDDMFPEFLNDLENAKDYIFLEFFIVSKGIVWDSVLEILKKKVREGVLVRFMYDGTCSFMLLPSNYPEEMESFGIECKAFNPVIPVISTHYNNRDHRKIVVIDGKIAYTGGVNLADEYINQESRFGHWKDTAIRVTGDAVKSFILMFLENWNITKSERNDYDRFLNPLESVKSSSFILPFGDNPFDDYQIGEATYMHMLQTAKKYVHIIMPYLIIDNEMIMSLCFAAQSGVDIKIIMPGIADKTIINYIGHTYYKQLLDAGVEIFHYTPGFTHAKMYVSDNISAVVGTINMDFRSLYLHFEDGVYLYDDPSVMEVEKDFQDTLEKCAQINDKYLKSYPFWKMLIGRVLRVFAPLL